MAKVQEQVMIDRPAPGFLRSLKLSSGLPFAALLLLGLAPLFVKDGYINHLLVVGLLFGAQAMVSDFTIGFINISNFGFAAFLGLGAYTSGIVVSRFGVHPLIGMALGMALSGLLGFFTGILTMRLRGLYVSIMAWFMALALQALALVLVDLTRGSRGLFVPSLFDSQSVLPYFYLLLFLTTLIYTVIRAIINSKVGLAFRAIGQDVEFARASGVNPTAYKMIAFTLSCAFAGLLGGFYAHFIGILTPDIMGTQHTVEIIALNTIGGRGSIWGPLLAAFIVILPFEYLKSLMEVRLIIYGLLLVLVMVFYPTGLAGILSILTNYLKKRKSNTP